MPLLSVYAVATDQEIELAEAVAFQAGMQQMQGSVIVGKTRWQAVGISVT